MAKKKRKTAQLEAWCWYCDREFEDEKVLLQHQKAKHYRCPQCPRRLNTAGGLAVHLTQVHKAEPDRLENTLPGRDTFDVEIYGMVGIPEKDLAEWKERKAAAALKSGKGGAAVQSANKRPRIEKIILTTEQLRVQLEAHKALMSGQAPAPVPSFPPGPGGPPPPFGVPPPPLGLFNRPPPTIPPPGFAPQAPDASTTHSAPPPPSFNPYASPPSGEAVTGSGAAQSPPPAAVHSGTKSRMVYADSEQSPEEKLARSSKYSYQDTKVKDENSNEASGDGATSAEGEQSAGQAGRSGRKIKASDLF